MKHNNFPWESEDFMEKINNGKKHFENLIREFKQGLKFGGKNE